ncbi:MAG: class I SAM-dependent methyltransferase [Pseudomonadota bacterium]
MVSENSVCPVCGSTRSAPVLEMPPVPVLPNAVYATREAGLAADTAAIELRQCLDCGHVYNAIFDEERVRYAPDGYGNPLGASAVFRAYQSALVGELVERFGLEGRAAFEIGAGDGSFLAELVEAGMASGIGLDPSSSEVVLLDGTVQLSARLLSDGDRNTADLLVMRHVLEHLADPAGLLRQSSGVLRSEGPAVAYLEVPNGGFALGPRGVWDVIYEHPSIFTARSMATLVARAGLAVEDISAAYDNQFLQAFVRRAESTAAKTQPSECPSMEGEASAFAEAFATATTAWGALLAARAERGDHTVIWGAGSKGVMFCNLVAVGGETVIDASPAKQGRFIPGTGQPIEGPSALQGLRDPLIIVMNDAYLDEIKTTAKTENVMSAMAPPVG